MKYEVWIMKYEYELRIKNVELRIMKYEYELWVNYELWM
jgi:hypothetical protein